MKSDLVATSTHPSNLVPYRSHKVQEAYSHLLRMAYRLGPNTQMPTFADLCVEIGVSKATLDTALGQLEAAGIVSRRQGAGIFVAVALKRGIALVCDPQFSLNPNLRGFWELMVRGAQLRVAQLRVAGSHYDLAFHFSTIETDAASDKLPLHLGLMDDIRAGRVQGVLAVGLPLKAVQWMSDLGVVVVEFAGKGPVSVDLEIADVVKLGVETLVAQGCTRLALWSEIWSRTASERRDRIRLEARTFRRTLAANGLEFHRPWLRPQARELGGDSIYELASRWASQTFSGPRASWPDGLIVTNDILARDVMPALQKLDIVANRDILIASHANTDSPVLRAYQDDLILLEYDSGEIVQSMFDQLETLMRGEKLSAALIKVKPRFQIGELVWHQRDLSVA